MILPLISLPGDLSGLAGTNVLNTQLDTGHMEMTTIVDAVKDSGAIDVTLEDHEQDDDNPSVAQVENCSKDQPLAGGKEKPAVLGAVRNIGSIEATGDENNDAKYKNIHNDNCNNVQYINNKCHQGTQTELSRLS